MAVFTNYVYVCWHFLRLFVIFIGCAYVMTCWMCTIFLKNYPCSHVLVLSWVLWNKRIKKSEKEREREKSGPNQNMKGKKSFKQRKECMHKNRRKLCAGEKWKNKQIAHTLSCQHKVCKENYDIVPDAYLLYHCCSCFHRCLLYNFYCLAVCLHFWCSAFFVAFMIFLLPQVMFWLYTNNFQLWILNRYGDITVDDTTEQKKAPTRKRNRIA